jgi:two-component system, OmpR family, catabolic regulation response regulator CreB
VSTILIVEDEAAIADTLAYVLRTEGHETMHVTTGAAALERLALGGVALAIVDVGLPDIGGFELVRRMRSHTPVMFLTAHDDEVDRVRGFELGADDYVAKPFSPREVAGRVRAILRRVSGAPAALTEASGDFRHDQPANQVRFHGVALALTRYEYLLLAWLLQHPGRVFTRDQLLDAVWGHASERGDRTVDTHVKTLRAKLREVAADADPIQTHRGFGYSLQP